MEACRASGKWVVGISTVSIEPGPQAGVTAFSGLGAGPRVGRGRGRSEAGGSDDREAGGGTVTARTGVQADAPLNSAKAQIRFQERIGVHPPA